jgi:hypothetical protein
MAWTMAVARRGQQAGDGFAVAKHSGDRHDLPVSVDTFWRRTDPNAVQGLDPPKLRTLVPHWFDDRFRDEAKARITVGAEDTGALIGELLRLGADNAHDAETAWLAVSPEGLDEDYMVGVLTPDEVARVAEFLSHAHPAAWMQQFRPKLAVAAREMGYQRPFDDEWAQTVVTDLEELAEMFRFAAAAAEAVIVTMVA